MGAVRALLCFTNNSSLLFSSEEEEESSEEEEGGSSDESSGDDQSEDEEAASDVSDDKSPSSSRKRKSSSHDDVMKSRFRSRSPEDKKGMFRRKKKYLFDQSFKRLLEDKRLESTVFPTANLKVKPFSLLQTKSQAIKQFKTLIISV